MEAGKKEVDWDEESTEELQDDLKELIKKKCKLEQAEKDGWLNADNRLREVEPEIEAHVKALKARKADVPDMSCTAEETSEKPKPKKEKKAAPPAKSFAAFQLKMNLMTLFAALMLL